VTSTDLYELGDLTIDLRRVEVRRAGELVPLEPKSFDVLRHLVENRDRLVTKEELLETVWKDTFVTPNVLTRAVAQLRKGLGDDAFEARYIETVAKRGYRFIAPVTAGENGLGSQAGVTPSPDGVPPAAVLSRLPSSRRVAAAALVTAAVLAAAWGAWRPSQAPGDPGREASLPPPRRLSAARDLYATPAISPDGRSVAWVSSRTGKPEIYVSSLAPGSRELAVTSDGSGALEPAFSPDGLWLAFRSLEREGIWIIPRTGGAARQVADFGSSPAWSPDSRSIVFTDVGGLSSQARLFTVALDGAAPAPLTRLGSPPGGHLAPGWSHDGRWIAFRVNRHQANEVWIVAAAGGAPRRLATLDRFAEPRFAPDDRALYWFGRTADQNDCLVRLRLDAEARPVGGPETVLAFQGETVERLSIARDGTAVFLWNRLSANLWAIDVDARLEAGPPRPLTTDDEVLNRFAEYSADGRLVFEQHGAGRPPTAWVMDDDGGNREPLSPGAAVGIRDPQWDPEGRRVFAQAEPGKGEPRYFAWIDLPSRRLTRIDIPSPGGAARASLSPDGRHVAYHLVADDGVVNVWVQPLDGGPARQVTFDRPGQAGSDSPTSIRVKRPSAAHCANQRRSVSGVGASRCRRARDTALPRGRPSNRSERRRKASRLSSLR
jgi:DNA-binding winged helix-turn-helix (wHTH) protein/Tol biopolymer transport system component